ncbi:uncharacterized protein LOC114841506 [Diachasma alloeum]|uniref:uncharacterized protein LOC114841506 n=1 Tax=Diachasma alloeum TaxID=454923 RepID=UPI0010FAF5D1|nr:uncharacterized protein LOC114841506 [Diachasma alloeum]
MKRRLLNKYAIPSQNLPSCSNPHRQQEFGENPLSSPSARGSTSPFQKADLLETNVTPRTPNSASPGTRGSTSKFKVTQLFEGRDVVKCDLRTIFDVLNDVRCDNPDCPEMQLSESLHTTVDNLEEPEPEDLDPGMRVPTGDTTHIDVSVQVDSRDLAKHADVSIPFATRDRPPHVHASVQVTSGNIYSPFSTKITTDHQLSVLCGIRNHKILDRLILEITTIYPEQRKHKMTLRERVIMTMMKLKNDLKFSCLAVIFNCVAESTCRAIFVDTLQKLARILQVYHTELAR